MRGLTLLFGLIVLCAFAWLVAGWISPDAIQLAVGLLFGVLAGIPTAALIMASNRPRAWDDEEEYTQPAAPFGNSYPPAYQSQPYSDIEDVLNQSAFGGRDWFPQPDDHDSPRVVALPISAVQANLRRVAGKGLLSKITDDYVGGIPPGNRRLQRVDKKIMKGAWQ